MNWGDLRLGLAQREYVEVFSGESRRAERRNGLKTD